MAINKHVLAYKNTPKAGSGNVPLFPRFYFKHVGGRISIYHKFTHCFMESFKTEEEVRDAMVEWNDFSQTELWEYLLFERYAQLVKPMDFAKRFDHDEDWYVGAWGIYTAKFYEKYPNLFREELEMPYAVAFEVKKRYLDRQHEQHKKAQAEREIATKRLEQEEKQRKVEEKQGIVRVEIGNAEQAELAQKKKRKIIPLKKKKGVLLKSPVVSDNPFD